MTSKDIFCNSPWYELHIYWDGSLGICCQEDHKLYSQGNYNIATTSIAEWFNSEPVRNFRLELLGSQKSSLCRRCYVDENHGGNSRRLKALQKSVIFQQAFDQSYQQSPGIKHFEYSKSNNGWSTTSPVDMHIDLGNYCNLACKMCNAQASSSIAAQEVKWGIESSRQYLGQDWTKDSKVWHSFLDQILAIPNLQNIHFMGGETLLTDRLESLVDCFIEANKVDVGFSLVTNGTVYKPDLLEKLSRFRRVGLEISIETTDEHNSYQRQGTDTPKVLANIRRYVEQCNNSTVTVALRPAPSLLTVGYYWTLLEYALEHQLVVKSNFCSSPAFLDPTVLPIQVKKQYQEPYTRLLARLPTPAHNDYNASDPNNYQMIIAQQASMINRVLQTDEPANADQLRMKLVNHCRRWDQIYGYDARKLYPELNDIWIQYGY